MKPALHIHRFYTTYEEKDGQTVEVDWCTYSPVGGLDRTKTSDKISRLSGVRTENVQPDSAAFFAKLRWEFIKPYYTAWKEGKELPEDGTPLSAWSGITQEQIEVLKTHSIRTVEALASLTDTHVQRFKLPNIRTLIEGARIYLQAKDTNKVAKDLEKKDLEIAALKDQIEELTSFVKEQLSKEAKANKKTKVKEEVE